MDGDRSDIDLFDDSDPEDQEDSLFFNPSAAKKLKIEDETTRTGCQLLSQSTGHSTDLSTGQFTGQSTGQSTGHSTSQSSEESDNELNSTGTSECRSSSLFGEESSEADEDEISMNDDAERKINGNVDDLSTKDDQSGSAHCERTEEKNITNSENDAQFADPIAKGGCVEKQKNIAERRAKKKQRFVPLHDMRWGYLSVTDLVAQSWCEQQLFYGYFPPTPDYVAVPLEEVAPAVAAGQEIHQERDAELGEKVLVETRTKEDRVAMDLAQLLECLRAFIFADSGEVVRREIPIFGFLPLKSNRSGVSNGTSEVGKSKAKTLVSPRGLPVEMLVSGVIDELRFDVNDGKLTLVELKTRFKPTLPGQAQRLGHNLQVMLYGSFYSDLVEGRVTKSKIALHRKVNLARVLSSSVQEALWFTVGDDLFRPKEGGVTLGEVFDVALQTAKAAPRIQRLQIDYVYQGTKEVIGITPVMPDQRWLEERSVDAAEFWMGKRETPRGVDIEDAWKCSMCEFEDDCAWRREKLAKLNQSQAGLVQGATISRR